MKNIIIVGGGAAGMMAAIAGAGAGHQVHVYEKNEKLGKKIYITGKGRCNVTNACDVAELFQNVIHNPKFLYSSFYTFTNEAMMELLKEWGCPVKVERGNRVFPVSDRSSDVIRALSGQMRKLGVTVHLQEEVDDILTKDGGISGIRLKRGGRTVPADAVVIATGGLSYPTTGSTGSGYHFAEKLGHTVTELSPALVPFETKEPVVKELQGLSLRNVGVRILKAQKILYEDFGEMLFTHYGVSGPVLLSASSYVARQLRQAPLALSIDLKPALSEEQLDARILRDFEELKNKQYKNALVHLLPAKLIPVIVGRSAVLPEKPVNKITREERRRIAGAVKHFTLTLTGLRDYKEAVITQGGIAVEEVNPQTMESRKVKNLYFAGEVLDLDAVTGGFNLQIAWSTGYLAGISIGPEPLRPSPASERHCLQE